MPPKLTPEEDAEVVRLRKLAAEIEAKIPRYEERRPDLAKAARASVRAYRATANKIKKGK